MFINLTYNVQAKYAMLKRMNGIWKIVFPEKGVQTGVVGDLVSVKPENNYFMIMF